MNTAFIAVLLMSATGALLVLCMDFLRPLTKKRFSASWHYHTYILVVFFLLVPIGAAGGNLPILNEGEMPNVPVIINGMITAPQNNTGPTWQPQDAVLNPNLPASTTVETAPAQAFTWNTVLSHVPFIWIGGIFLFVLWHGIQLVRFRRRIHRTSLPIEDTATSDLLNTAMNDMRIKGNLRLYSNDIIKTPMLVGLFKTCLILPDVEMSGRELAVILKHELVHYKRRDLWVKSLALLANAIHWFNPAVYRLTKQLGIYCELSCDERVVADMSAEERRFYGETILNVLSRSAGKYSGVYATLAESQKGVKRRLKHMMGVKKSSKRIVIMSLIAAVVLCLTGFAAASVINMQRDAVPDDTQEADDSEDLLLQTPEQGFNIDAILQGDLSEFEGIWENDKGDRITLKSDGTLHDDYIEDGITYKEKADSFRKQENGNYMWGVSLENYDGASGYSVWFYPVGVEVWTYYGDFIPTDTTKVRLYAGHDFQPDMTGEVYYRQEIPLEAENTEAQFRTETITLEGFDEEIQTKLYVGDSWSLYYDFERYNVAVDGNKTIIYPIIDPDMKYAYATIEHIANVSVEDELHRRMEEAAKTYTGVTRYDETDGFYAVHDDGIGGLWSIDDYLLSVQLISDGTGGCYVLSKWHVMEASEGHGVRLGYMFNSFTPLTQKDTLWLTLDESGKNDDTVQLLGYAPLGWYSEGVDITVTLGNGGTYSQSYDEACRNPALLHADLTGDGIDEIIVVLPNATSNFAATNVHVLSASGSDLVEVLTILCTPIQKDIDKYAQTWLGIQDFLCTGASVAVVDGRPVLRIEQLGRYQFAYTDISWGGGQWAVGQQEITKYFLFSNNPQKTYDMQPQPLSILDESQVIRTLVTEKTEDFTQAVYRSKTDEDSGWNFFSYIEINNVKYGLGHIGYGNDDYYKDGLKQSAFNKFMEIDGVTLYVQHKWYGASYDAMAFYEIVDGVPCFLYEIANVTEFYQDGNLLTLLSSSRSQPLNIVLFCMDIPYDIIFVEDLRELLGCWAVGYNFEQKLVYAYDENNKNDPVAMYRLEGLELVKQ